MSLRTLFVLLFTLMLATSLAIIMGALAVMRHQLGILLPADEIAQIQAALTTLFAGQAIVLLIAAFILLFFLFFILGRIIVAPLRRLARAMEEYAKTSERLDLPELHGVPSEIRALRDGLHAFAERVEVSHKQDVEISRVKSDFISTAAHQLRTPLTGIRWALEALEKESLTEGQGALVKSAKDKSHELVTIVGTLLDISSIESGKYKYEFKSVDLAALASEVAQNFQTLAGKQGVSLLFEGAASPLPRVRADRERIRWVLNNLVENGIRYTPSGGSVRLTTEAAPGRILLHVRDTGIGIPSTDQANIFERFYRAENAISQANEGNGLGLYIARTIANDHGGDLNFKGNGASPGTTFTLSLPTE